jgi:hypothetical protein
VRAAAAPEAEAEAEGDVADAVAPAVDVALADKVVGAPAVRVAVVRVEVARAVATESHVIAKADAETVVASSSRTSSRSIVSRRS